MSVVVLMSEREVTEEVGRGGVYGIRFVLLLGLLTTLLCMAFRHIGQGKGETTERRYVTSIAWYMYAREAFIEAIRMLQLVSRKSPASTV